MCGTISCTLSSSRISSIISLQPEFETNYIFERPKETFKSKVANKVKNTAVSKFN
jgi:hypothetical protein